MPAIAATELILIRHAPALSEGRMAGRRDVDADCSDALAFARLRARLDPKCRRLISPARRCRQTAATLWPDDAAPPEDPRLWEQDFGTWEDQPYAGLPDLGPLSLADLAAHRPPQGESFNDLTARVAPVFDALLTQPGTSIILAHAGVIRAALGLALGQSHLGLAFQIAPLSLTRLIYAGTTWSIACVNEAAR
ncbi:MAG: histidine phosphatase family protein [Cypionkella sp.]